MSNLVGASVELDVVPLLLGDPAAGAGRGVSEDDPQHGPHEAADAGHVEHGRPAPRTGGQHARRQQLHDCTQLGT